jgi:hypothetical protein
MPRGAAGRGAESDGTSAPFFFEGIESPNGTIFPDTLLDLVMPFLSPTEWKVCSYVVRRTFGWKKASDRISLEQICHGIVRRDGSRLDYGTQLDRKTAIKALRGLEAKGVIVAQRNYSDARGYEATSYGLRFRGQTPTRTLGGKIPQGSEGPGENLPQGAVEPVAEAPGEDFPQPSGSTPPALVASGHLQPTSGTTTPVTSNHSNQSNHAMERPEGANGPAPPATAPADGQRDAQASGPLDAMRRAEGGTGADRQTVAGRRSAKDGPAVPDGGGPH